MKKKHWATLHVVRTQMQRIYNKLCTKMISFGNGEEAKERDTRVNSRKMYG